ncbi:MAG: lysophospholipase [Candidatus Hydrogenedentes bacterium]|nr:lysophospholipase [Candidatus Hydrogenedentota bacterium]
MGTEEQFRAADGESLFARRWLAEQSKGALVLIHGYGEHCGRYDHVAAALNAISLHVYSYDQRGHGRSPGKRGHIASFAQLVDDLGGFLRHLEPEVAGLPLFLLGHSMGGLVLASFMEQQPAAVRGLVFTGTLLCLNNDVSPWLVRLSKVLSTLTPGLPVATVDPQALSRDATVVHTYQADPFVYHGKINARTGAQLNEAMQDTQKHLKAIMAPLYILHGAADRLAPAAGSELLYKEAGAKDKTLRLYEGGYHEQFNDMEKERVFAELCTWLQAHLAV